jgi:hypothetical protein
MNTKKARGDSKLKTLPTARQAQIVEHAQGHKLWETLAWLNQDGIKTSSAALSEFLSWHRLGQRLERIQGKVERGLQELRAKRPGMAEEEMQETGYVLFSAIAMDDEDPEVWKIANDVRTKQRAESREQAKFQRDTCTLFIKWAEDQRAKAVMDDQGTTNTEKIERLGQLMFGENWK